MRRIAPLLVTAMLLVYGVASSVSVNCQDRTPDTKNGDSSSGSKDAPRGGVRAVTIPITVRPRGGRKAQMELQPIGPLIVREDGEEQRILSIRGLSATAPLSFAVLIQDDVVSSIGNEIRAIADFIRRLPRGSRVMVGYITRGSLQVRQKFTTDLERAAGALRIPIGSPSAAPLSPYLEILEALRRFESLPAGRRAMLVVSDGLDTRSGFDFSSPASSLDLQRAIKEAQRRSVAIYSFYAPTVTATGGSHSILVNHAQGSLQTLSSETGGRAFFQGTGAPVSFDPFLRELGGDLTRQLAITYLSTHPKKGYHRIEIRSLNPNEEIDHPAGYTR